MNDFKSDSPQFKLTFSTAIFAAFISVVCLQLIASTLNIPSLFWEDFFHVSLPLSFLVGGVLAIVILLIYTKTKWKFIAEHIWKPTSLAIILLSILLYALMLPFAEFLGSMVPTEGIPFLEKLYKGMAESFEQMFNFKIAAFITICILAPILEEIIFRGIILRGMLQNGSSPVSAIIISALLFGIAHLNPWQFFGAGFLGAVFGFVYYRTKSLWLCMFLHALNNTLAFIFMLKYQTIDESISDPQNFTMVALTFIGALAIGWILYKLTENKQKWI